MLTRCLSIALFAVGLGHATALGETPQVPASAEVLAFERFVRASTPVCERRPAADCIDAGWGYADLDGDGKLSVEELTAVRNTLVDWTGWRGESLKPRERANIALGVWLIDSVGLERLLASYSTDVDGKLSRDELLADVTLDERPLGEVLLDAEAVDREATARRLGELSPMLKGLLETPQ